MTEGHGNVKTEVKGSKLTITIDLSGDLGWSKSGKTKTVASTHGFRHVTEGKYAGTMFSVNVNRRE